MNKWFIVMMLALGGFVCGCVNACELQPEQELKNDQAYFTANLQKQPKDSKHRQGISNHFTFFTINVQINGKLGDIPKTEK